MDFITDLPSSAKSRVKTLLIITDWLSKGVILMPILIFTLAVTTAFIKYYILYHRFLMAIINNKGTKFTSAI